MGIKIFSMGKLTNKLERIEGIIEDSWDPMLQPELCPVWRPSSSCQDIEEEIDLWCCKAYLVFD